MGYAGCANFLLMNFYFAGSCGFVRERGQACVLGHKVLMLSVYIHKFQSFLLLLYFYRRYQGGGGSFVDATI